MTSDYLSDKIYQQLLVGFNLAKLKVSTLCATLLLDCSLSNKTLPCVCCPPDDMQRGEERPLIPQPANESPGSLRLGSVQLWEQILWKKNEKFSSSVSRMQYVIEWAMRTAGANCFFFCLFFLWQGEFSYQVFRHSSIAGDSQDLCEEVGVAVSSNPQIHHLSQQKRVLNTITNKYCSIENHHCEHTLITGDVRESYSGYFVLLISTVFNSQNNPQLF